MRFSELTPQQQAEEILGFAREFQSNVLKKIVYNGESDGGGYALTSPVRENLHIPTGTASSTIADLVTSFSEAHGQDKVVRRSFLVEDLQRAVGIIESTGKIIDNDPYGFPEEYKGISERISGDLPEMKVALAKLGLE